MKISIFTPTHKTDYLEELYTSIKKQAHQDWERIILFNNGATKPERVSKDKRIIGIKAVAFEESKNIGYRKKHACSVATGDILLEADHDDMLTPDCLEEISKAFEENPNVGFVYSDNAKLGPFVPYNKNYGRADPYHVERLGEKLPVMPSQPITPHTLGYIRFLPDHVRAWRRTTYEEIGGHNPTLEVCDDQELLIRTYLHTDFHHIPEALYIYRITGDNTSINHKNQMIQEKNYELYNKYIYQLAEKRAERNNLRKIDVCGGFSKPYGYESIDLYNGDITADLNKKRPIADNSVGVVRAHDAMEHLVNKEHTMKEIHRILAPGGILLSSTPSTDGRGAFQDPTHVAFWNQNSFRYWIKGREQPKYIHNTDHLFGESALYTWFPSERHKEHNISYVQANLFKPL